MDSQLPKKFKKEQDELVKKLLAEGGIEWDDILEKYASSEYREYVMQKRKRDEELLKKGIIEN